MFSFLLLRHGRATYNEFSGPAGGLGEPARGGPGVRDMHVIECPSCSSLLKVPKPVREARLKCRKCGVVFVGTSRPMRDPAPEPAPEPATPSRTFQPPATFRVTRPPRSNNAMIFITVAAGAVLVGLVVAVHSVLTKKPAEPAPKAQAPEPARPAPPAPPPPPVPQSTLFPVNVQPAPVPPGEPTPAALPKAGPPPAPVAAAPSPPENLSAECHIARLGLPGVEENYLQGSVRNERAEGLKSVTVEIRLPVEGKAPSVVTIVCEYLAPGGRVAFLKPFYTPVAEGFAPQAQVVKAVPLAPKQVCWSVKESIVKGDDSSESRTITGTAKNPLDVYVSNIEVYADVYFSDGRSAGPTIKGKLEHGNSLPPGGQDDFSLSFTPASVGTRMQAPAARIVGTVP